MANRHVSPHGVAEGDPMKPHASCRFHPSDERSLLVIAAVALLVLGLERPVSRWLGYARTERHALRSRPYAPWVDLNRCDWPELCLLPGINETRARRLIAQRELRGGWTRLDQLLEVDGIGPKTLESLQPWVGIDAELPSRGGEAISGSSPLRSLGP